MSNEVSVQDKMAVIYKRMLTTIIFLLLGWAVLLLGVVTFVETSGVFISFLAFLIAPAPMLGRIWIGGFRAMFELPEYEVVTTYASGRKESDGGMESAQVNMIVRCIFLVIMIVIGFVATAVYLVILLIKYIVLYIQAKPKPAFIRSAFFLIIIAVLSLPGIMLLCDLPRRVEKAAFRTEHSVFLNAIVNAEQQNMTAYTIPSGARTSAVTLAMYDSDGIYRPKEIPIGEAVTIIGPADNFFRIPVMHEGDKGTIRVEYLSLDPPNQ